MPQPSSRVLVAGAGDVGLRVARACAAAGAEALALRRRRVDDADGVRMLTADLASGEGLRRLPSGIDAVVFSAAPDARDEAAYRRLFLDGTRRLMDALDGPPSRVVFVSSTAVYGEDAGERVDEDTPPRPGRFNGEVLLAAERWLAGACTGAVALRLTGLYGPGRTWLLRRAFGGEPARRRWSNRIHVEDAASAVVHLLDLAEPPGTLIGSDDRPTLEPEVLDWLRARRGLAPLPLSPGPETGRRASNVRLRATGWTPTHPDYRSGYPALLDGFPGSSEGSSS